jgi:hypothetical protein
MDHPDFRYEIQNGYVNPARDIMKGGNLEWFSVQHWVAAEQDNVTAALVPVDGHLVTLGDVVRGAWPKEFGSRKGTIFSYLMSNYWETNWPAGQGGDYTFRYAVTSGPSLSPGVLSRLGWQEMSPIEIDEILSRIFSMANPHERHFCWAFIFRRGLGTSCYPHGNRFRDFSDLFFRANISDADFCRAYLRVG